MRVHRDLDGGPLAQETQAVPSPSTLRGDSPHWIEHEVHRELCSHPHLQFSSLVVRRIDNGVCLTGVMLAGDESPDVCDLALRVAGVNHVLNHLVVQEEPIVPLKG